MEHPLINCLILAAGKGTRMKSAKAKVLHQICAAPMLHHVLAAVADLPVAKTIVVIGHQKQEVAATLANYPVTLVIQEEQLGTGHAVSCAEGYLRDTGRPVLILCGDVPLIRPETLQAMLDDHNRKQATLTVMTTTLADPAGYGRIISDGDQILRIIEDREASAAQKKINEINAGIYCAEPTFLFAALKKVRPDNSQSEIYLTDIIEIASNEGKKVNRFAGAAAEEVLGVNSMIELERADQLMRKRKMQS